MTSNENGALIRGLRVLEYFRSVQGPARLKDIVAALGYPTSSTAELLKDLAQHGYLAFDTRSRTYMPTPLVAALGAWIPDATFEDGRALAAARALNEQTGELIFLGTPNGLFVQYLEALKARHPIQYVVEAGRQRFLVKSGLGWALLSVENEAMVDRIHRRSSVSAAGRQEGLPSRQELFAKLAEVRRLGYAFSRNLLYRGASVIAVVLPCHTQGRRLALGIAGPTDRIEENMAGYVALLKQHAEDIAVSDDRAVGRADG